MAGEAEHGPREPQRERIERHLLAAPTLPSEPLVLLLAEGVIQSDHSGADDLERLALLDPSLALRLLRLAGSAAYGGQPSATLGQAIMRIGFDALAEALRVALQVNRLARVETRPLYEELWTHSVLTGLAAEELLRRKGEKDKDRLARARLLGLIHDVGRMLLLATDPERYAQSTQGPEPGHLGGPGREQQVFGLDHELLGRALARKWNLGTEVEWVLGGHHFPSRTPQEFKGPQLICLADWVALKCQDEWMQSGKEPDRKALASLGLGPPDLRLAAAATAREWEAVADSLRQAAPLRH